MKSPRKTTVTLEDLLRLKRSEQPPADFWAHFEREMRAKQLAAIVEPRPWWAPLIRFGARASHLQLPIGAAAILVVSFITVREYRSSEAGLLYIPEVATQEVVAQQNSDLGSELSRHEPEMAADVATLREYRTAASNVVEYTSAPEITASGSHVAGTNDLEELDREPSPSERYIAANLAAAQEADPRLMDDVFGRTIAAVRPQRPMRDPLAEVSAPGESRRARLLATALPVNAGSAEVIVGTSDRMVRDLTERRLYDTISRVGLKGDRVAIKF